MKRGGSNSENPLYGNRGAHFRSFVPHLQKLDSNLCVNTKYSCAALVY